MKRAADLAKEMEISFAELREIALGIGYTGLKRDTRLGYGDEADFRLALSADQEEVEAISWARCPVCAQFIDYCLGHSEVELLQQELRDGIEDLKTEYGDDKVTDDMIHDLAVSLCSDRDQAVTDEIMRSL